MSRFVAATPNAEVNVLAAQLATELGVPHVVVLLRRSDAKIFQSLLKSSGVSVMLAPENLTEWELALTGGAAHVARRSADHGANAEPGDAWLDGGFFPFVVETTHDRSLYTAKTVTAAGDELIGVQLPAVRTHSEERIFIDAGN